MNENLLSLLFQRNYLNKLSVREILSLSFVCGAYFFEFRGLNLVCFVIAYNFNGKYAPEAGKTRMCKHVHCVFHACLQRDSREPLVPRAHDLSGLSWALGMRMRKFALCTRRLEFPPVRYCGRQNGFNTQNGWRRFV